MKKDQIEKGGRYRAKVSGRLTTVRVLEIRETVLGTGTNTRYREVYDVLNEATGRRTTFRSAARFRGPAPALGDRVKQPGANGRPDPAAPHPDYARFCREIEVLPPGERPRFEDWLVATAARRGGYVCPHCGQIHVSDDTALWCGLAKDAKNLGPALRKERVVPERDPVRQFRADQTHDPLDLFRDNQPGPVAAPRANLFAENNPRAADEEE